MDGVGWGLLLKPLAAVAILVPLVYLSRIIDWVDDRLPDSRWKRFFFKRIGDYDLTDPPHDPGRYQRQRAERKRQQAQRLNPP